MKHQIKHRFTDAVLFECDVPDNIESGMATRHALEKATMADAYLAGANLAGAYLAGANLAGAYLADANLAGANLAGANLAGANLADANLAGAKLGDDILTGDRPIFQIGPIGSRGAYLVSYLTDKGVKIKAGCFYGSLDEFVSAVLKEHGDSVHGKEYLAAIQMIETHVQLWSN